MNMPAQGTDAWLNARRGKITASVIGKIITGSGKEEVLRDMVREALGYPRAFQGNAATDYGTAMEDEARTEYALEFGRAITETGFHAHPEHDWLGASPDGIADDRLVEIKCPFKYRFEAPPEDAAILEPDHLYWHQMQCQMHVMGVELCDFVVWSPQGMEVQTYHREDGWLGRCLDHCLPFLAYLKDVLADPEEAERVADMTQDMSGDDNWLMAADHYMTLDRQIKQLKAKQDEIRQGLVEMAGERKASGGGVTVSPVTRSGGVDYKTMAAEAGVDPEQYRKPATTSWQIRVNKEAQA